MAFVLFPNKQSTISPDTPGPSHKHCHTSVTETKFKLLPLTSKLTLHIGLVSYDTLIKRKTLKPSLNYEGDDVISRISTGLLRSPSQENANVTLKPNNM